MNIYKTEKGKDVWQHPQRQVQMRNLTYRHPLKPFQPGNIRKWL